MSLQEWLKQFSSVTTTLPPLDIYFLGDGVGESIIINLEGTFVAVVDAYGGSETSITRTLLDYLGIKKVDYLQLSHLHRDHYAGLYGLLDSLEVGAFGRPDNVKYSEIAQLAALIEKRQRNEKVEGPQNLITLLEKLRSKKETDWCSDPNAYKHLNNSSHIYRKDFQEAIFEISCLAPLATLNEKFITDLHKVVSKIEEKGLSYIGSNLLEKYDPAVNRTSVVNKIRYGAFIGFFTGDTDSVVLDNYRASTIEKNLRETKTILVKVPHHGSSTSNADILFNSDLLGERNRLAVISPYNSQGLPEEEVVNEYLGANYELFRTSTMSKSAADSHRPTDEPDGVVKIRIEHNGNYQVSTWGSARQITKEV
jgi:beta-lactamase superfamily II metal-dependent hydrolase